MKDSCSVEDCDKAVHSKGFCQRHYRLFKKYGVPENKPKDQYKTPGPKVDPSKPRSKAHGGLRMLCAHGHQFTPENTEYLPSGKRVCLTCKAERSRDACRKGHQYTEENTLIRTDGVRVCRICNKEAQARYREKNGHESTARTHCKRGHEFTEENTGYGYLGKRRICLTCRQEDAVRRTEEREARTHCINGHEYVLDSWSLDIYGNMICHECRRETNERKRLRTYGITLEEYQALEERQGHGCAVCRRPFEDLSQKPAIDHFHDCCPKGGSCGECVRGLLCKDCNTALGLLGDSPALLLEAAQYLMDAEKFRAQTQ